MSLKHCVIGDSHATRVHAAWKTDPTRFGRDHEMTFFIAPDQGMELEHIDGLLINRVPEMREWMANTSGGTGDIKLAQFDHIWLVGLELYPEFLDDLFDRFQPEGRFDPQSEKLLISDDLFESAADAAISDRLCTDIFRLVRSVAPQKAVSVVPCPFPIETICELRGRWARLRDAGIGAELAEQFHRSVQRVFPDATYLIRQPPETLISPHLTAFSFSLASERDSSGEDIAHGNSRFGEAVLETMFRSFDSRRI